MNVVRRVGTSGRGLAALCAFALLVLGGTRVEAQDTFPSRNITLIVPITAASAPDIVARLYADRLSKALGVQVVVTNRPGASGIIGAQAVLSAPADGYTLQFANASHSNLAVLAKNLPFDPIGDFAGITMVGETPYVLIVPPSLGVRTVEEFIALAKSKPGTLNYGSAGTGSATHIAAAYFATQAGIDLQHVSYRSSGDLFADLMSGRIHAFFPPPIAAMPMIQENKVVALGVSNASGITTPVALRSLRSANIDYQYESWYGFIASAKTPPDILKTLDRAIVQVSQESDLKAQLQTHGVIPRIASRQEFEGHIVSELARMKPVLSTIEVDTKR